MLKKILKIIGTLILVLVIGVLYVFYPKETILSLPDNVNVEKFSEIEVEFEHKWPKKASFPFLGAAIIDIEGDGSYEIFLGGSKDQEDALMSYSEGKLINIIEGTGLSSKIPTYGATSIDMDNDGDTDLVLARHDGVYLLNNDSGVFTSEIIPINFPKESVALSVAVSDIDHDGDGDLYVSIFVDPNAFKASVFNDSSYAKKNIMLRNDDGIYTDITAESQTASLQNTFLSAFVDIDGDNWQDLVVAQNTGKVEIFKNLGGIKFESVASPTDYGFWMSIGVGDIDNDGDQDLFFSNAGNTLPHYLLKGDLREDQKMTTDWTLLRNDGDFSFTKVSEEYGLIDYGYAWGAVFEDLNLDGKQDMLVAQNYIQIPNFKLRRLPGKSLIQVKEKEENRFYQAEDWGLENKNWGQSPLIADINNDGKPDVIWINMNGKARAFINNSKSNFVTITMNDNVASLGTKVTVVSNGINSYTKEVMTSIGFLTDQTPELFFGLGHLRIW